MAIFWRDLVPPQESGITCPRCWAPLASVHVPRWYWLMALKRFRFPVACPCHHTLTIANMQSLNDHAEMLAEQMEKEAER